MKSLDYSAEFGESLAMLERELRDGLNATGHTWLPRSDRHSAIAVECGEWMTTQRQCWAERTTVRSLRARQKLTGIKLGTECPAQFGRVQWESIRSCLAEPVSVLRGGPGTGKTYTVGQVARALGRRMSVEIVAPTGMAARREHEASGMRVRTIHGALKWDGARFDRNAHIDCDLLIVAESSMVSTYLLSCLLTKTSKRARVLFVGDPDQLPSVEPGQVLLDLTRILPTFALSVCHRYDSTIHDWATAIMGGIAPPFETGTAIDVVRAYERVSRQGGRMLTYRNNDVRTLNALARKLNPPRYVVCLRNDRQLNIFNGMIGVADDNGTITWEDGHITGRDCSFMQAYCTTIHKAQGSGINHPVIYVPSQIDQCLLYTAITRTVKTCEIIANADEIYLSAQTPRTERFGLLVPYWRGEIDIPDPSLITQK